MSKERKTKRQQYQKPVKRVNPVNKSDHVETKTTETKLRVKPSLISLLVFLILFGIFFAVGYLLFGGLIEGAVLGGCFAFVWILGRILDKPKTKSKGRKALKILIILFLIFVILALLGACAFIYYVVDKAPDFKQELLKEKESTILYDSKGKEYAKLGLELRENIEYNELSESFIDALIATEDSRFFQHNGVDMARFLKAAFH